MHGTDQAFPFQFCDIKKWQIFPKQLEKLAEYTLSKHLNFQ